MLWRDSRRSRKDHHTAYGCRCALKESQPHVTPTHTVNLQRLGVHGGGGQARGAQGNAALYAWDPARENLARASELLRSDFGKKSLVPGRVVPWNQLLFFARQHKLPAPQ